MNFCDVVAQYLNRHIPKDGENRYDFGVVVRTRHKQRNSPESELLFGLRTSVGSAGSHCGYLTRQSPDAYAISHVGAKETFYLKFQPDRLQVIIESHPEPKRKPIRAASMTKEDWTDPVPLTVEQEGDYTSHIAVLRDAVERYQAHPRVLPERAV